jgi:hypothetical protein
MVGLLAAVERYVQLDHAAEWRVWEMRAAEIIDALAPIPGIRVRRDVPEIANHSPHVVIEWTQGQCVLTADEVVRRLRAGDPPIALLREEQRALRVAVWTLRDNEPRIVVAQLELLLKGFES